MASPEDPFAALMQPVLEAVARQRPVPRHRKGSKRAVAATWLLVAGVYETHDLMVRHDLDIAGLLTALAHQPAGTAAALGAPILWCAMAFLCCLSVVDGVREARAPHEAIGVFWLFCLIGGCTYALVAGVYLDGAPIISAYLRGVYLATLAASVMELFLFTRCGGEVRDYHRRSERRVGGAMRLTADGPGRARWADPALRGSGDLLSLLRAAPTDTLRARVAIPTFQMPRYRDSFLRDPAGLHGLLHPMGETPRGPVLVHWRLDQHDAVRPLAVLDRPPGGDPRRRPVRLLHALPAIEPRGER